MSEAESTDPQFPDNVEACHDEIRRLSRAIGKLESELEEIEEEGTVRDQDIEGAIHSFLDEVERTAPLRFQVPTTDRANRAIVGLHDAVGRRP